MRIMIAISPGELLDRLSILEIRAAQKTDPDKHLVVLRELEQLNQSRKAAIPDNLVVAEQFAELKAVNQDLWDIRNRIRACELEADFGPDFVALARSVYRNNDRRAALRHAIDREIGGGPVESKSYA